MESPLDNIRVVLVSPLYGGNIGAVCRALMNCGMTQLVIAEPRDDVDMDEARQRAYRAIDVLENRKEFPTVAEAVADCGLVAGTTARIGLYRAHAKSPREWAPDLLKGAATGPVALLFGPEDKGLSNDHLSLCTQMIQIPSSPMYRSLNLSHAVMICLHEIYVASDDFEDAAYEWSPEARNAQRERMFEMWRETLLEVGFMKEDKAPHMMMGIRRILSRGKLTESDVKILMGMARQCQWAAQQPGTNAQTAEKGENQGADMDTLPDSPTDKQD
jgi:tRNA/rRNA methyltransferase